MIRYPDGTPYKKKDTKKRTSKLDKDELSLSAANRGMDLEHDINLSNEYYNSKNIALIYKRPTPINIVKVDYTHGAKITSAYFEEQSTTDYNGIYKGRYVDFEAKSTKSKTSFPLANITSHQIEHLKKVNQQGGIAFFIIQFEKHDKVFLLDSQYVIDYYDNGKRKSIPYEDVVNNGIEIKKGYSPRLFYIDAIEQQYFKK